MKAFSVFLIISAISFNSYSISLEDYALWGFKGSPFENKKLGKSEKANKNIDSLSDNKIKPETSVESENRIAKERYKDFVKGVNLKEGVSLRAAYTLYNEGDLERSYILFNEIKNKKDERFGEANYMTSALERRGINPVRTSKVKSPESGVEIGNKKISEFKFF